MSLKSLAIAALVAGSAAVLDAGQRKPQKPPEPPPIAPLVVSRLLDTYAAGQFDEAVREVAQAPERIGVNLRAHWSLDAPAWIDALPEQRSKRLLVAAALVLETETVRIERGEWGNTNGDFPCPGSCALDWAQARLVERGTPDAAEKAWYLAAASLAGGVRDWRYLQRAIVTRPQSSTPMPPAAMMGNIPPAVNGGLTERALLRFPDDPQIRLEQALAASGRFSTTVDGGRLTGDLPVIVTSFGGPGAGIRPPGSTVQPRDVAREMLQALVADPVVGPEAQTRLGYFQWAVLEDDSAKRSLTQAAERSKSNPDVQYLARFLLGWIALQAGKADEAIPELEAALLARPDSQSAAVALATLKLQKGDATEAYATARASIDRRNTDDDPWRLFLYGHHPMLAERIKAMRAEVRK